MGDPAPHGRLEPAAVRIVGARVAGAAAAAIAATASLRESQRAGDRDQSGCADAACRVQQRGITGSVEVEVDLNADSKITTVSIDKSSDPALNAPALMAARASTFKTQVVNCRPVAASYLYIVEFPPH